MIIWNGATDRYRFICERATQAITYFYEVKYIREYDDAVVAVCDPPDSHMKEGLFVIPQEVFLSETYVNDRVDSMGYRDTDPRVEEHCGWDTKPAEKYQGTPLAKFFVKVYDKNNQM